MLWTVRQSFNSIIFLTALISLSSVAQPSPECFNLTERVDELVKANPRTTYVPLLSKDLSILKTLKFTGPGPQPNMSRDVPEQQFFFNEDSPRLFEIKGKILSLNSRRKKMIQIMSEHDSDVKAAVEEQFIVLYNELPTKNPEFFKIDGDRLVNLKTGSSLSLHELKTDLSTQDAIYKLSQFVNEDLIFLKKPEGSEDFITIAALLAVPTRISTDIVLGEGIMSIHAAVSEDPEKTARFSQMINNSLSWLFTNPKNIVRRNNFFLESDPTLSMPDGFTSNHKEPKSIDESNYKSYSFLRTERQTLRGLPNSQVVVFTILPKVYSVGQIMKDPELAQNILKGLTLKYSGDESEKFAAKVIKYLTEDLHKLTVTPRVTSQAHAPDEH